MYNSLLCDKFVLYFCKRCCFIVFEKKIKGHSNCAENYTRSFGFYTLFGKGFITNIKNVLALFFIKKQIEEYIQAVAFLICNHHSSFIHVKVSVV